MRPKCYQAFRAHSVFQGVMQMRCAWQEYIRLLPHRLRSEIDEYGKSDLQEVRLRIGQSPVMVKHSCIKTLPGTVSKEDLDFVINTASNYSPWAAATSAHGYITAAGGHRIGICGDAVVKSGEISIIKVPTSLCLRVSRDFPGIADGTQRYTGSILIIGPPGSGKTTLLRDIIRQRSSSGTDSIAVLDERGEIFPFVQGKACYDTGSNTDILTGCGKQQGIDMLLRTMGPGCIAVDEITEECDCNALLKAGWCGVSLIATAHAATKSDLYTRPVYSRITANRLFDTILVLQPDKTWKAERIEPCT